MRVKGLTKRAPKRSEVCMPVSSQQLHALLHQYWQTDSFRALQLEAISATLQGRDSLVILPTGMQLLCPCRCIFLRNKLTVTCSSLLQVVESRLPFSCLASHVHTASQW